MGVTTDNHRVVAPLNHDISAVQLTARDNMIHNSTKSCSTNLEVILAGVYPAGTTILPRIVSLGTTCFYCPQTYYLLILLATPAVPLSPVHGSAWFP